MTKDRHPIRPAFPASETPPLNSPLIPSVAFTMQSPDQIEAVYDENIPGSTYARESHPNSTHLAIRLNQMEMAAAGIVTGSGMGAITATLFGLLNAGDHMIAGRLLYGGTLSLLNESLPRLGIETSFVDSTRVSTVLEALRPETKLIFVETISNPTMRVSDLQGIINIAQEKGILVVVDNTLTTPIACNPLVLGANIVIHSVTKLLSGHSDAMLGYLGGNNPDQIEQIRNTAIHMGLTPSPFDCWLTERSLMSFSLRYQRSEENAKALAAYLNDLPGIKRVLYPGNKNHPDKALTDALLGKHSGTMLSFEISGGRPAANRFFEAVAPIRFVPTLGDITTTLSHPLSSSHRSLSEEQIRDMKLSQSFFRVSVGIDDIDFLKECFARAVAFATNG